MTNILLSYHCVILTETNKTQKKDDLLGQYGVRVSYSDYYLIHLLQMLCHKHKQKHALHKHKHTCK